MKNKNIVVPVLAILFVAALMGSSWGAYKRLAKPDADADPLSPASQPNTATFMAGMSPATGTVPGGGAATAGVAASPPSPTTPTNSTNVLAKLREDVLAGTYGRMPIQDLLALYRDTPGGREIQEIMTAIVVRKEEALPIIQEQFRTGSMWEKTAATKLLSASPWPETYEELLRVAQSKDERAMVRQGALFALGALGKTEAGESIVEILREPGISPAIQLPAISALGRIGYTHAVDILRGYTTNRNEQVCIFAWRALSELGHTADREYLLSLLDDPDYAVREDACGALARVDGDEVEKLLRRMAEQDENQAVRQGAHQALIRRGMPGRTDSENAEWLQEELARAEWHTQPWIVRTLLDECGAEGRVAVEAMAGKEDRLGMQAGTYLIWNAAR